VRWRLQGWRGRLGYSAQGKARESDGGEERLFHEDSTRTIHASHHVSQRLSSLHQWRAILRRFATRLNVSLPGLECQVARLSMQVSRVPKKVKNSVD
jgi:hypothetical protein